MQFAALLAVLQSVAVAADSDCSWGDETCVEDDGVSLLQLRQADSPTCAGGDAPKVTARRGELLHLSRSPCPDERWLTDH